MAIVTWPPPTPVNTRANASIITDAHPADHNMIADALDTVIARLNSSSWGIIPGGLASLTASQTGIATTAAPGTALTGAVCNVTTLLNRRYSVRFTAHPYVDTVGATTVYGIFRDGVAIQWRGIIPAVASNGMGSTIEIIDAPTPGAHTYTVNMYRGVGSGNVNNSASAAQPCQLIVEDVGPTNPT